METDDHAHATVRSGRAAGRDAAMMRAAAVCSWLLSLGFGLPGGYAIWYFAEHGAMWTFLGYPTYGYGPFEDIGLRTSVPLLSAFLLVCVAEFVAGWLLWRRRPAGTRLALALLPFEFAFWIGFALPFGPVAGLARTVLVAISGRRPRPVTAPDDPSS